MVGFVLWVCLFVKSLFVGEHLWVLILVAVFLWKQVHIFIFNNPPSFGSFSLLLTTLWTRKNTDGALLFWSRVWIFPQRLTFFFFFQLCLWCLLFCCFSVLRHQKLSFRFMLTDKSLFVKLVINLALKVQQSCLFETQTMELWSCHAIRVITPSPLPMGEYQSLQPKRTHTDNRSFPQARLAAPVFGHFILVATTHALLCAQHVSFNGANCESLKMFKVKTNGENTLFRSFQNATRCLRRHEQQNWEECQQLLFGHCLHQPNVQNRVLCVHSTNGNCLYPCHWHLQHSQFNRNHLHETGISHVNVKTNKQATDLKWQLDDKSATLEERGIIELSNGTHALLCDNSFVNDGLLLSISDNPLLQPASNDGYYISGTCLVCFACMVNFFLLGFNLFDLLVEGSDEEIEFQAFAFDKSSSQKHIVNNTGLLSNIPFIDSTTSQETILIKVRKSEIGQISNCLLSRLLFLFSDGKCLPNDYRPEDDQSIQHRAMSQHNLKLEHIAANDCQAFATNTTGSMTASRSTFVIDTETCHLVAIEYVCLFLLFWHIDYIFELKKSSQSTLIGCVYMCVWFMLLLSCVSFFHFSLFTLSFPCVSVFCGRDVQQWNGFLNKLNKRKSVQEEHKRAVVKCFILSSII